MNNIIDLDKHRKTSTPLMHIIDRIKVIADEQEEIIRRIRKCKLELNDYLQTLTRNQRSDISILIAIMEIQYATLVKHWRDQ